MQNVPTAIAGHSLGGAMAVLAAYDIVDLYPWKSVSVYTVGAPRPGNQAFADKYDAKVPDTWHLINPSVRSNCIRQDNAYAAEVQASQPISNHTGSLVSLVA